VRRDDDDDDDADDDDQMWLAVTLSPTDTNIRCDEKTRRIIGVGYELAETLSVTTLCVISARRHVRP